MQFMRTFIILVAMALTSEAVVAQDTNGLRSDTSQTQARKPAAKTMLGRVALRLKGTTPADGLLLLPAGWHPSTSLNFQNISGINLVAYSKKSLIGGTFNNSFGDRVWFLGVTRTLISKNRFGLDYSAGLMVGYKGRLAASISGPLKPLFEGNLNPYIAISPYYQISDRLEARILAAPPNIVGFGLKYRF